MEPLLNNRGGGAFWINVMATFILSLLCLSFLTIKPVESHSERMNLKVSSRNIKCKGSVEGGSEYDSVSLDNYIRTYIRGPLNDEFAFFKYDVIAAYAGPAPKGHPVPEQMIPDEVDDMGEKKNIVRAWAMFDDENERFCDLNQVHDWGEFALFTCFEPGIYRAYAYEYSLDEKSLQEMVEPTVSDSSIPGKPVLTWISNDQKENFDLMLRPRAISHFPIFNGIGNESAYKPQQMMKIRENFDEVIRSDPIEVKPSYFCYTWSFSLKELSRTGYLGQEVIPPKRNNINESTHILYELRMWIAEPNSLQLPEMDARLGPLIISDYSRVITDRFSDTGLFPCLRKAHPVIKMVTEMQFISSTDQKNPLDGAPHWLALIKVHTDRLISTLSDVTFTIASRQNTGTFNCFVADVKVYISVRHFEFVPKRRLERGSINLGLSNIWYRTKINFQSGLQPIYGRGVQYIGDSYTKVYQPSTNRTDLIISPNPCSAAEFSFSVGGSLYVTTGLLRQGVNNAVKVILPDFNSAEVSESTDHRSYLQVSDVAFTPTHLLILMAEGYVMFHPTNVALKGIGNFEITSKYRPTKFVKRKSCPKTATPKFSAMTIPLFSRAGNIIILQLNSIEGSVRMWITPPTDSCLEEARDIISADLDEHELVNETEIHYREFAGVRRTNQVTGLQEPPPPYRPPPPPPRRINLNDVNSYIQSKILDYVEEGGGDPHFPAELLDPARHQIGSTLDHFNEGVVYVVEDEKAGFLQLLKTNGITNLADNPMELFTVEFGAIEKQFIAGLKITAQQIPQDFGKSGLPMQIMITTVTVTNLPFRVKLRDDFSREDEVLNTKIPFPGTILIRSQPYKVPVITSRDPHEEHQHTESLKGDHDIDFNPEVFMLSTAIPSYVINFGDIIVYTSIEGRFARPVHFYDWDTIDTRVHENYINGLQDTKSKPSPLLFEESSLKFSKEARLYDTVVSDNGVISILWRKQRRHFLKQEECEEDDKKGINYTQSVAIGSVISFEGLREVKPFFRHDNIFQRVTPDGEILYGVYDTKPHDPFPSCRGSPSDTANDTEACIEQEEGQLDADGNGEHILYCARGVGSPCKDPAYLDICDDVAAGNDKKACIRKNKVDCRPFPGKSDEKSVEVVYQGCPPSASSDGASDKDQHWEKALTTCWPKHAPREEIRFISFLGTPFSSYLLGSLQSVKSLHPEAYHKDDGGGSGSGGDNKSSEDDLEDTVGEFVEPDICPFASFSVYNTDFDFAEVGYRTRVTGEISYYGTGIPTEADILVEFEQLMGVIIEISSNLEEQRSLTTIRKTIDIEFRMTDFLLREMLKQDNKEESDLNQKKLDFDDIRAREKSEVFSITIRPSIVNGHCRSADYFKTVQFNVGCNTFSTMRVLSEATALVRTDLSKVTTREESEEFRWEIANDTLYMPLAHVSHKQVKDKIFNCTHKDGSLCLIPYYSLFGDNIFTISYRDYFQPKFEQFLTVSTRVVDGNVVVYDMLGSDDLELTVNKLQAGCVTTGNNWYSKLLNSTHSIGKGSSEHENIYKYFVNCFDKNNLNKGEDPLHLSTTPFYLHNLTNFNRIKFARQRNQLFIFRAVVVNTVQNRFTYCKTLETYFMVRIVGIPIPRQGLPLWAYVIIVLLVMGSLLGSYWVFYKFYTWKAAVGESSYEVIEEVHIEENQGKY